MKKLHIFMLKSFAGPFIATFLISMFVLIMQFVWRMIDDIVGKGLDFSVILELLTYMATSVVPMALPLAVLLSSIMTFGNLGEYYELIALKSAGVSLYRIMKPLIYIIIILTFAAFFFSNNVMPVANLKLYSLLYDIRRQKPEAVLKEGIFINDIPGLSIKVDKIDKESGVLHNVMIYSQKESNSNYEVTKADSATLRTLPGGDKMELTLFRGHTYTEEGMVNYKVRKSFPLRRVAFKKEVLFMDAPNTKLERTDDEGFKSHAYMLNTNQLASAIDSVNGVIVKRRINDTHMLLKRNYEKYKNHVKKQDSVLRNLTNNKILNSDSLYNTLDPDLQQKSIANAVSYAREVKRLRENDRMYYLSQEKSLRKYDIEKNKKFTLSFACFIFFFIGAPLGAIIRKGGLGMPVVVSVILFVLYYVISMMGERSAKEAVLSPFLGTWISSIIMLILGVFLTYKSVTDSEILSSDIYIKFYNLIKNFFRMFRKEKL